MHRRAIVLGLDGLEPSIVEAMLERGELPNFRRLRESGFYGRLATTYPAQTPVAWSSFVTGANPGVHGIFDFVRRDPATYRPDFALSRFEKAGSVFGRPKVVNCRQGEAIWSTLTRFGVPSVVLRCPGTFPPDAIAGRMLAGVGVPDLRGSQGKGTFYSQGSNVSADADERVVAVGTGDVIRTFVPGPMTGQGREACCELTISRGREDGAVELACGGSALILREGGWSPWQRVKFKTSALQTVTGLVRFYLRRNEPSLELYASPVNFDPEAPLFPISAPPEYARALAREIGPFSTLGMAEDHAGLNNGRFDEGAYAEQCASIFAERERMTMLELGRFTEGLFFVVFDTPDRVNHMHWGYRDARHPASGSAGARELAHRIEECYSECDRLLGRILEAVDERTLLIVLSDHGCSDFRRAFHINSWLRKQGLLTLREHGACARVPAPLADVDWQRTRAYALGFGSIYLNLAGREGQGVVAAGADAERVVTAIREGLSGLADPETGETAIRSVFSGRDLYSGPCAAASPDLVVNFAPGYRASWQTALGEIPAELFADNLRRWSGDHLVDPMCVPGVVLMNNRSGRPDPAITDMAPTILDHLRVPVPDTFEGKSLLE